MNNEAAAAVTEETGGHRDVRTSRVRVVPPPLPPAYQTEHDPIVHTGAPPIAEQNVESKAVPTRSDGKVPSGSLDQLHIVPRRRVKQESTGWLSSIVLHAVLVAIIGLILAPADYGGANAMKLIISFSDQEADDEIEVRPLLEVAVSQNEITPQAAIDALPLIEPLPIAAAGSPTGHSVQRSSGNATRGIASPRGSFFGIEAHGHEFVYVLDMSGSMEGRRFRRASAELERSVSELQESQNFYVLLFDDTAVQMFHGSGIRPKSVPATAENKAKLSEWLSTAYRGGGTDPRDALRIALRMNPSAIFMLSDGKFNGQKNQRSSLVRGNSDAFALLPLLRPVYRSMRSRLKTRRAVKT